MKWKSPRCGQACWDEIKRHVDEREKIVVALVNMTRDRDEWREQHENLLAMYRAELPKNTAMANRTFTEPQAAREQRQAERRERTGLDVEEAMTLEEDCGCVGAVIGQHERSCPLPRPKPSTDR